MFKTIVVLIAVVGGMTATCLAQESVGSAGKAEIPMEADVEHLGARMARTNALLACSSPSWKMPVKILFYGQSIIADPKIREEVLAGLKEKYPHAEIVSENRSIGGYEAPMLWKTCEEDLYPYYPDLLVLHVYSGEKSGEYERIIRETRKRTTAEILLWTHHVDNFSDRDKSRDDSSAWMKYIAAKYGCEIADVRGIFKHYLETNKMARSALLAPDGIHLNPEGCHVIAQTLLRHFTYANNTAASAWYQSVKSYDPARTLDGLGDDEITYPASPWKKEPLGVTAESPDMVLRLKFVGNRVDVLSLPGFEGTGSAKILIDGKVPSEFAEAYTCTRPSAPPVSWFPGLNMVRPGEKPVAEEWTLTASGEAGKWAKATYEVCGSVTGPDGQGSVDRDFISKSGRLRIRGGDFMLARVEELFKKPLPSTVVIKWKTLLMGTDNYRSESARNATTAAAVRVIQGISNGEHTLEVIPNGDGPVGLKEIVVYSPPLR